MKQKIFIIRFFLKKLPQMHHCAQQNILVCLTDISSTCEMTSKLEI